MRDELQQIDISAIADLVRIKREEEVLRERLARMDAARAQVSPVVYARVRSDYESRKTALEDESQPLKERARREYVKLKAIRGQVERLVEESSLEKEEIEFRRELGEYTDADFQTRISECEKRLAERRSELDEIEMLRAQFIGAFHAEHELEIASSTGEVSSEDAAAEGPVAAGAAASVPASSATAPLATGAALAGGAAAASAAFSGAETVVGPRPAEQPGDATRAAPPGAAGGGGEGPSGPPAKTAGSAAGVTVALTMPRIVQMVDNKAAEEHLLKPGVTSIGRSPRSHIRLPQSEVSRHHADIVLGADGYRVMDAGSDNGIFVNGQRVSEQVLADGDVIQIGMQRLVFRA